MLQNKAQVTFPLTKLAVVDIETRGLTARYDPTTVVYMVGIGLVYEDGRGDYVQQTIEQAVPHIQKLLTNGWVVVMHNASFDYAVLKTHGLRWRITPGVLSIVDTMCKAYAWDSSMPSYSLGELTGNKGDIVQACVDAGLSVPTDTREFWATDWSQDKQVLEVMGNYLKQDVRATLGLYKKLAAKFNGTDFGKTLAHIDLPMLDVLVQMERTGSYIDKPALIDLNRQLAEEKDTAEKQLRERYGKLPKLQWKEDRYIPVETTYAKYRETVEVEGEKRTIEYGRYKNKLHAPKWYLDNDGIVTASNSTIVYDHCELVEYNSHHSTGHNYWVMRASCPELLEKASETDTGKPKLDKEYFADIADEVPDNMPIAKLLKVAKRLQKTEELLENLCIDGRLHSNYNNCQTRTGRLSSSKPNLCNLERSDADPQSVGSKMRQLFTAPPGRVLLVADLDQIELRVLAFFLLHVCKDKTMAELSFDPTADVHQSNADKWGVSRTVAKTVIFLLIYGGGAGKIFAKGYTKTLAEAEQLFKQVNESQPSVQKLKQLVWETTAKRGYLTNPFCARGVYPELYNKDRAIKSSGQRKSFNFLIQRTARDVMHMLAVESYAVVESYGSASIINSIYDELHIECDETDADSLCRQLNSLWQDRWDILPGVRINGTWNQGDTWYLAK